MCIACIYFSTAVKNWLWHRPYLLREFLVSVLCFNAYLAEHLSEAWWQNRRLRKIQLCLSGQVDELMQQKLKNLKLAVDGEKSGKQKKGRKSEKVRAAIWEKSG